MNVDTIIYEYSDAAVPPPFHRSYVIVLNHEHAKITVTCYEETIHELEFPMNGNQFECLVESIASAGLKNKEKTGDIGVCGGASEEIDLQFNGETVFSGSFVHGQHGESTLTGDLGAVAAAVKGQIPDIDALIASD